MANNAVRTSGADAAQTASGKKSGFTVTPGPYEAIVMKHVEGSRMGQLLVYIPEISGQTPDAANYIPVSYASPFYGTTYGTDTQKFPDNAQQSGQSYGMWMVPPDVGCKVLVTFAAGDRGRGYWFACIYDSTSHHMVPAIGRNIGGSEKTLAPNPAVPATSESVLPVVEYSTTSDTAFNKDGIDATPRRTHEYQASILIKQGLDRDKIRGAISSSSLRESPSNVYGISTPGRKITAADQVPGNKQAVFSRRGGHTFVMDDGDKNGKDQLIRLRTSGGHQILMNDSDQVLYIASASGNHWLEFSSTGQINVFANNGFNLRAGGPLNLHSDVALNMSAPVIKMTAVGNDKSPKGGISMATSGNFGVTAVGSASLKCNQALSLSSMGKASLVAGGQMSVSGIGKTSIFGGMLMLNTGSPGVPLPVTPPTTKSLPDTKLVGSSWQAVGTIASGCTVAPAHEPWVDSSGKRPKK